ncbi:hypothetical protein HK101_000438 [Irineochytrium annulatum]|nr:hypothetical protein HK101_000438 [Irineochytrium annulatum]
MSLDLIKRVGGAAIHAACVGADDILTTASVLYGRLRGLSTKLKCLKGKVVLITGASKGIGEQIAYTYAMHGAVLILAARTVSQLEEVAEHCRERGAMRAHVVQLDAGKEESCVRLVDECIKLEGHIDVLVLNHAAVVWNQLLAPADEMDDGGYGDGSRLGELRKVMDVNFFGSVTIALKAIPHMTGRRQGGNIVVVNSVAGKIGTPFMHAYGASKFAINGFFSCIRFELQMEEQRRTKQGLTFGKVHISQAFLGAIGTDTLTSLTPEIVRAVSVSPVTTAQSIVQAHVQNKEQIYHPAYVSSVVYLDAISQRLAAFAISFI